MSKTITFFIFTLDSFGEDCYGDTTFMLTEANMREYIVCRFVNNMSGNNSVVECNLAKVDVASSNLVSRSNLLIKRFDLVRTFFIFLIFLHHLMQEEEYENLFGSDQ